MLHPALVVADQHAAGKRSLAVLGVSLAQRNHDTTLTTVGIASAWLNENPIGSPIDLVGLASPLVSPITIAGYAPTRPSLDFHTPAGSARSPSERHAGLPQIERSRDALTVGEHDPFTVLRSAYADAEFSDLEDALAEIAPDITDEWNTGVSARSLVDLLVQNQATRRVR